MMDCVLFWLFQSDKCCFLFSICFTFQFFITIFSLFKWIFILCLFIIIYPFSFINDIVVAITPPFTWPTSTERVVMLTWKWNHETWDSPCFIPYLIYWYFIRSTVLLQKGKSFTGQNSSVQERQKTIYTQF